ncbi:hypothetical protein EDC96DRAFT_544016 [Choanephora cucurbitarum]|nr:hypothetical protein EDC96DRAFT_544016 [Choanephora cucurbitarum]
MYIIHKNSFQSSFSTVEKSSEAVVISIRLLSYERSQHIYTNPHPGSLDLPSDRQPVSIIDSLSFNTQHSAYNLSLHPIPLIESLASTVLTAHPRIQLFVYLCITFFPSYLFSPSSNQHTGFVSLHFIHIFAMQVTSSNQLCPQPANLKGTSHSTDTLKEPVLFLLLTESLLGLVEREKIRRMGECKLYIGETGLVLSIQEPKLLVVTVTSHACRCASPEKGSWSELDSARNRT